MNQVSMSIVGVNRRIKQGSTHSQSQLSHLSPCMMSLLPWCHHPSLFVNTSDPTVNIIPRITAATFRMGLRCERSCPDQISVFALQGEGADSGPQPSDGGGSTQHPRCQPAGSSGRGVAEYLAAERRPETALWAECKHTGSLLLNWTRSAYCVLGS